MHHWRPVLVVLGLPKEVGLGMACARYRAPSPPQARLEAMENRRKVEQGIFGRSSIL